MKRNGAKIGRQTTSLEVLTATDEIVLTEEGRRLRGLYIRARYDAVSDASPEDVRLAEELLSAIKKKITDASHPR